MAEQIKISNGEITAVISTRGAELKSVVKNGREFIWEGDPNVWAGQAPLLFPICGGLKDDKYVLGGNEYTLEKHGFARFKEFSVESREENKATFLLREDGETLKKFPFRFELRVTYTLNGGTVEVDYSVKNCDEKEMFFSIGAHEGYACPEGIEEYSIIFEKEEELSCHPLNGNLLEHSTYDVGRNSRELPLKYSFFAIDALTFLNLKSRKATLRHNPTGRTVDVEFNGFDYMFVWTKPNGKYICIEPWCGIPDFVDSDFDITKKTGINSVKPGSVFERTHKISL